MIGGCAAAIATPLVLSASASTPTDGVLRWIGTGSQVYACKGENGRFGWVLKGPDAVLTDAEGQVQGHHATGPSWTANDGSAVPAAVVMLSIPSPAPNAIPWLVLHASGHVGSGTMDGVGYVFRTDTEGGAAPTSACDSAAEGSEQQTPYRARYTFLRER
ncbi:MAG: DUF3455 domain-containing protein [Catenulispora sp.]